MRLHFVIATGILLCAQAAMGAVACTLDHPDRDIKRLVSESTSYKVRELLPFRHGKKDLMSSIEQEIGTLDREFETPQTPYTFYAVYKGSEQQALILGTNERAVDGVMQLFIVYDRKGKVRDIYVQKISSQDAAAFRSKYYRQQYKRFGINALPEEADVKLPVRSPTNNTIRDHHAFMRGLKFNVLIVRKLYNEFKE
jgi:hypothetical protein